MLAFTVTTFSCRTDMMAMPVATSHRENRMPPWVPPQRFRLFSCMGSTMVAVPSSASVMRI